MTTDVVSPDLVFIGFHAIVLDRRHPDDTAHFEKAGACAHPDRLGERPLVKLVSALSGECNPLSGYVFIGQVRGDDHWFSMIATVSNNRLDRVLNPINRALCAQIIQNKYFAIERRSVCFAFGGPGSIAPAFLNLDN